MNLTRFVPSWLTIARLLCLYVVSPAMAEDSKSASLNDVACLLAGTELYHGKENPIGANPAWQSHAQQMARQYESHVQRVLSPMSAWAQQHYDENTRSLQVVRYPFSGPDAIHALHTFPHATTWILVGLEPVGHLPPLELITSTHAATAFHEVRTALGEILNLSFFRTNDMKEDLQSSIIQGATPIISVFLALSSQYITDINYLTLQLDGTLVSQGNQPAGANGVKIDFTPYRLNQKKSIYYFSSDLSNGGFGKSGLETWLKTQPTGHTYLKAASYLLHSTWFSQVRDHLLAYSHQIVQDDSGIPYRFFDQSAWQPHLYGSFEGPISLFAEHPQPDLVAAYRQGSSPLSFGTGYKWRPGESNLMRFVTPP